MNGSVKLNNFIQTESLTKIGAQLLNKEFVDVIVYLKSNELDASGNVVYKAGFYKVVETIESSKATYLFKNVEIGGSLKFKDTLSVTNQDYLYEGHNFKEPDWDEIENFMKDRYVTGGCSGFVRDGKFYRSFDFLYNNTATFIVHNHTCGFDGVAGGIPELTKKIVDKHEDNSLFDYVPYYCLDGINRSGIVASIFMVHRENDPTKQTYSGRRDIYTSTLVSYILTNLHDISDDDSKTGLEKLEDFMSQINVIAPNKPGSDFDTEYHYLVSDGTKTFAIEFVDNETKIIDISDAPYITNFYLDGYDPDDDSTLNLHCNGVERYNLIKEGADLEDIKYTQMYSLIDTDKVWRSEFNGNWDGTDITKNTTGGTKLARIYAECKAAYEKRKRGDGTWHTQHASVYDFKRRSLKVCTQENYELWWKDWSKRFYKEYKVNEGWSLIDNSPEIYYDDKECTININMKFTPYDQNTMTCDPYEYTNVPLTNMLCPLNITNVSSGITALDICPIPIKITNNDGSIELGDNVTDFHWEITYRWKKHEAEPPKPLDYVRLDMFRLFPNAEDDDEPCIGYDNEDFLGYLYKHINSITLDV